MSWGQSLRNKLATRLFRDDQTSQPTPSVRLRLKKPLTTLLRHTPGPKPKSLKPRTRASAAQQLHLLAHLLPPQQAVAAVDKLRPPAVAATVLCHSRVVTVPRVRVQRVAVKVLPATRLYHSRPVAVPLAAVLLVAVLPAVVELTLVVQHQSVALQCDAHRYAIGCSQTNACDKPIAWVGGCRRLVIHTVVPATEPATTTA